MKIATQEVGLYACIDKPLRGKSEGVACHNRSIRRVGCVVVINCRTSARGTKIERDRRDRDRRWISTV